MGKGLALPAGHVDPRTDYDAVPGEADRASDPGEGLSRHPARNKAVQQAVVTAGRLYQLVRLL
jgi:hypothetical protein